MLPCGTKLNDSVPFCRRCGYRLDKSKVSNKRLSLVIGIASAVIIIAVVAFLSYKLIPANKETTLTLSSSSIAEESQSLSQVNITPGKPTTYDDLRLSLASGNMQSNETIKWFKNNIHISSLDGNLIVPKKYLSVGDEWYATLTSNGAEVKSNTVKVLFKIVFGSNGQIYTMNSDGSNVVQLTHDNNINMDPSFSPDGTKIIFDSRRNGNYQICMMNSDGSGVMQLTNDNYDNYYPSFSPDGIKILFQSYRNKYSQICVMNLDGSNLRQVTNGNYNNNYPSFFPEGTRITFLSDRNGMPQIYIMNSDGSGLVQLTNEEYDKYSPCISPDGNKIVFYSCREANNQATYYYNQIFIINTDGSGEMQLTDENCNNDCPSFSPDGNKIIFYSDKGGCTGIYTIDTETKKIYLIRAIDFGSSNPSFSHDGDKIVFQTCTSKGPEIFTINTNL